MFEKKSFQQLIENTLEFIGLKSENAVYLLMGTCAQESLFGKYRRQLGNGPALGVYQMEPATFNDIVSNFLAYKPKLADSIKKIAKVNDFNAADLINNDVLATCMARVHYLRVTEPIPSSLGGWSYYWKKYYNTYKGKGNESEFIENFKRFCV